MKKIDVLQIINDNIDDDIKSEYKQISINLHCGTTLCMDIIDITDIAYKTEYIIIWEHILHQHRVYYIPYDNISYISFNK